jgi:hypothetical protein
MQMERNVRFSGFQALEDMAERCCGAAALVAIADSGRFPTSAGHADRVTALCSELASIWAAVPDEGLGGAAPEELFKVRCSIVKLGTPW